VIAPGIDTYRRRLLLVVLGLACASCALPPVQQSDAPAQATRPGASAPVPQEATAEPSVTNSAQPGKGAQELDRAIKSYEEGEYKNAARQFQSALDAGLATKAEQASAHKYLAFMTCVSGREKACRDEFRKALDADPGFELAPAEIGHPIWGPVFRSVKGETAAKPKAK
jgi:Tfp pilus assembly protein PilF